MGHNKRIDNKRMVYVRQFSGSKVDCMKDYMKPCIRENNPDHLIFHVGTNNVPSNKKAKSLAESIVSLEKEVNASKRDVSISSIIPHNDNWNNKVIEVNSYLKDLSSIVNEVIGTIYFLSFFMKRLMHANKTLKNTYTLKAQGYLYTFYTSSCFLYTFYASSRFTHKHKK